jgi:NADH-quinone oxidoreductase subunit E
MFTVETVSCLGACGLAPVITSNEKVYAAMTPEKASELVAEILNCEGGASHAE